jgi:metal-responsive CopG/Arc/MetJ family transcriptional regulator
MPHKSIMGRFSVSVDDDLQNDVEEYAEEHHDGTRSHAVEELLRRGLEYGDRVDELETEIEHAEARAEDLRRSLQAVQERQDDVGELASYVERERTLEEQRREASAVQRARWWLFGMDVDDEGGP